MAPRAYFAVLAALAASTCVAGCGGNTESPSDTIPAGIGMPCDTGNQHWSNFGSYRLTEVNIRDTADPIVFCIVNHFQGRVGCPYGQSKDDLELPEDDPKRCRTPSGELVSVPVEPQLSKRKPEDTIHLSCRCAGPDPDARYCRCPSTMTCAPLVADLGLGSSQYAGSYCVQPGMAYVDGVDYGPVCDRSAPAGTVESCL